jgi:hypothetical protein
MNWNKEEEPICVCVPALINYPGIWRELRSSTVSIFLIKTYIYENWQAKIHGV